MKTQSRAVSKWAQATNFSFLVQLHLIVGWLANVGAHHYNHCRLLTVMWVCTSTSLPPPVGLACVLQHIGGCLHCLEGARLVFSLWNSRQTSSSQFFLAGGEASWLCGGGMRVVVYQNKDLWHVSNPSVEYLFPHQAVIEETVNKLCCLFCIFESRVLSFLQLRPFSARHATQPCSTHSALSGGNSFPLQLGEHPQRSLTTPVS